MTDSSADDRPLALGRLAETESPEIVRAALGRFRRRLLLRGLVVVLAVGAAVVLYPRYFEKPKELQQEILEARGELLLRDVKGGFVDATVLRAARLSRSDFPGRTERYGIQLHFNAHFLETNEQVIPLLSPDERIGVLGVISGDSHFSGTMMWIDVAAGTRTIDIPFVGVVPTTDNARLAHPSLGTLHVDMQQLHVPDWIWR